MRLGKASARRDAGVADPHRHTMFIVFAHVARPTEKAHRMANCVRRNRT
jgi:hypothetical protein